MTYTVIWLWYFLFRMETKATQC